MTQRAKEIGNIPIDSKNVNVAGITYRQWLIGQALANPRLEELTDIKGLINIVDNILEQLASEDK